MMRLGAGREFDLIRTFLGHARAAHAAVQLGPGDDCAIIPPFALSSDMSIENVHFRRAWLAPDEIGFRAATAALSDLAAVAAEPVAALISFGFSARDAGEWAESVMRGAAQAIEQYGAVLAGGDVTRSEEVAVLDVVVIGKVAEPVLRSGAVPGDEVWVTGTLGGAAAAVAAWQAGVAPDAAARARFAHPTARIREALWLKLHARLHALIDISDGIAGDAGHIAAASNCALAIDATRLPLHPAANLEQALRGGEDYELCLTVPAGELSGVQKDFAEEFGITLTRIGSVSAGDGVVINGHTEAHGFDHFSTATEPA